ncbi:MAG: Hsp20/alpha crystallin family protein [Oligoflexia bacterium]|nr:Hsp20/alpha crystallin family protein [Oligoflexia bacterium]
MRNSLDFFRNDFDSLFDSFFLKPNLSGGTTWNTFSAPACDVSETSEAYMISVDLPGLKKDDIQVEVKEQVLTIRAERKDNRKEGAQIRERYHGKMERSFEFSESVNSDQIEASYEDGVLRIAIPKKEKAQPVTIKIGESKNPSLWSRLLGRSDESQKESRVS